MTISLQATKRTGKDAAVLRQNGVIPGVIYGGDRAESTSFSVPYAEFERVYNEAGESTLIDFQMEGESSPVKVVIKDLQYDPVKDTIMHVDLKQVRMNEEMEAAVELVFIGEAPAVKNLGGTLVKAQETVQIRCLPKDLVSHIDVDLGALKTCDDSITIIDLKALIPATVEILDDEHAAIVTVSAPLTEEELTKMEESGVASVENIEVEEKGKKEDGEEGDADKAEKK